MKKNSLFLIQTAFVYILGIGSSLVVAQETVEKELLGGSSAPALEWSEQDFVDARPQSLPIAEGSLSSMLARGAEEPRLDESSTIIKPIEEQVKNSEARQLVDKEILPKINQFGAAAAGTRGAYFTSSRLIPTEARKVYPYSASGKLFFKDGNGRNFICSASVIRPRLVLTAGHCIHSGAGGEQGFFRDILFVPAWHEGEAPFGVWQANWVITTSNWATSNGAVPNKGDFAILEVSDQNIRGEETKIAELTGAYGYRTNGLLRNHLKIIGYPGSFDDGNIMHQVDTGTPQPASQNTVLYGSDMTGGSSGGPWIQNFGIAAKGQPDAIDATRNTVVGVTSYGFIASEPKVQGSSTLDSIFEKMVEIACSRKTDNC